MVTEIWVNTGSGNGSAITWTNVDWSSVKSSDIHIRAISQEMPQPSITKIRLKMTYLKFNSNFPGANELTKHRYPITWLHIMKWHEEYISNGLGIKINTSLWQHGTRCLEQKVICDCILSCLNGSILSPIFQRLWKYYLTDGFPPPRLATVCLSHGNNPPGSRCSGGPEEK